jgi:hypothetical protein
MKRCLLFTLVVATFPLVFGCGSSDSGGGSGGATASAGGAGTSGTSAGTSGTSAGTSGTSAGASGTSAGASGTGGGSSAGSSNDGFPAIDPTQDARMLSNTDAGELCDWLNAKLGGYGTINMCSQGSVKNDADQATCIANDFTYQCKVTVAQVHTCIDAEVPSKGCDVVFDSCHPLLCQ